MHYFRNLLVFSSIFSLMINSAMAATYYVDTPADTNVACVPDDFVDDDNCTWRGAVNAVSAGDNIQFLAPYTVVNTALGSYTISEDNVTVTPMSTVFDGNALGNDGLIVTGNNFTLNSGAAFVNGFDEAIYIDAVADSTNINGAYIGIENDGNTANGNSGNGIENFGSNTTIQNSVISANGGYGVFVDAVNGLTVSGNRIGVNQSQSTDLGNVNSGLYIQGNTSGNIDVSGNVIGGNGGSGVELGALGTLAGNFNFVNNVVGMNSFGGGASLSNDQHGLHANANATSVLNLTLDGNTFSDNALDGVRIESGSSVVATGNKVGTDPVSGVSDYGNGGHGMRLNSTNMRIGTNLDGASDFNEGNVVVSNNGHGIYVEGSGTNAVTIHGNRIGANSFGEDNTAFGAPFGNEGDGIHIDSDSVTSIDIGGVSPFTPADGSNIIIENGGGVAIVGTGASATVNVQNNLIGMESNAFAAAGAHGNNTGTSGTGDGLHVDLATGSIANLMVGVDGDFLNDANERNVIADNDAGVFIGDGLTNATVAGNIIGLVDNGFGFNADGGNLESGVVVNDTLGSLMTFNFGGDQVTEGNLVAGSGQYGFRFMSGANADVTVENNMFGRSQSLSTAFGNALSAVRLDDGDDLVVRGNRVYDSGSSAVSILGGVTAGLYGNMIGTDGNNAYGNNGHGVYVNAGSLTNLTIGGATASLANVIADSTNHGIFVEDMALGSSPVTLMGNYVGVCAEAGSGMIGTDLVGCRNLQDGLRIMDGALTVGGDSALGASGAGTNLGEGNVFSNNSGYGIYVLGAVSSAAINGNIVGLTRGGATAFNLPAGNGLDGVRLDGSAIASVDIGGVGAVVEDSLTNVISNNGADGLKIVNVGAASVTAVNNVIGADFTGMVDLGNTGNGVSFDDNVTFNLGNGVVAGMNVVSGNTLCGVEYSGGSLNNALNVIGLASDGVTAMNNDGGNVCDNTPAPVVSSSRRRGGGSGSSSSSGDTSSEGAGEAGNSEVQAEEVVQDPVEEEPVVEEEVVQEPVEEEPVVEEEVVQAPVEEEPVVEEEVVQEPVEEEPAVEVVTEQVFVEPVVVVSPVIVPPVVVAVADPVGDVVEEFQAAVEQALDEKVEAKNELPEFDAVEVKVEVEKKMNSRRFIEEKEEVEKLDGEVKVVTAETEFEYEPNYEKALELQKEADLNGEDKVMVSTFSDLDENGVADVLEMVLAEDGEEKEIAVDDIFSGKVNAYGQHNDCQFATEGFRITNLPKRCAVVGSEIIVWLSGLDAGKKFVVAVVKDDEGYEVREFFGEEEMDENGKGVIPVNFDEEGNYFIVARSEDSEYFVVKVEVDEDLNEVLEEVEFLDDANTFEVEDDVVKGFAEPGEMIFITWQSVVMNSVVIADAGEGYFEAKVPKNIAANEDHKVTVYSYNPENVWVSSISSLLFRR